MSTLSFSHSTGNLTLTLLVISREMQEKKDRSNMLVADVRAIISRRLFCGGTRAGTGRRLLTALAQVRFLPPQPSKLERRVQLSQGTLRSLARGSANGRPPAFEAGYGGSSPSPRTSAAWAVSSCHIRTSDPGQLLLVVTPGSDPGGRWFGSSPRNFLTNGGHPAG